jgi:4-hydroxy-tetrahydrodipicolinate reductase
MTAIFINGARGRMGRAVIECAKEFKVDKIYRVDKNYEDEAITHKEMYELLDKNSVLIDFSIPEAALKAMEICSIKKVPVVSGTTGFSKSQFYRIKKYSNKIPIFYSPNMSLAVNLTFTLVELLANKLDFDIHIHEKHHKTKKDRPSGTALKYLEIIKKEGRKAEITSARIGNIVGEHSICFAGADEKITIEHISTSRNIFARGALKAAFWLKGRKNGLYGFKDYFSAAR